MNFSSLPTALSSCLITSGAGSTSHISWALSLLAPENSSIASLTACSWHLKSKI